MVIYSPCKEAVANVRWLIVMSLSSYWQHFNSSLSLKFLARWNLIGKQRLWSLARSFSSCLHCWPFSYRNWYVMSLLRQRGLRIMCIISRQPRWHWGPYMFQWNDDRCTMKNNFICKYSDGNESSLCGCILSLLSPFIIAAGSKNSVT